MYDSPSHVGGSQCLQAIDQLLSSVHAQVSRQGALVARAEMAMRTCKRLLSTVQPQVSRQVALPSESRVAVLADVHHHLSSLKLLGTE